METYRRAQIQQTLRSLADTYKVMMELMEHMLSLLSQESALDPLAYFQAHPPQPGAPTRDTRFVIDPTLLTVTFRGQACFLGNTHCFRFISHLAHRLNAYVTYEDLLAEVWHGAVRSDDAVRSVVKTLRNKLRQAGLNDLASAIDGTVPKHYALKLDRQS